MERSTKTTGLALVLTAGLFGQAQNVNTWPPLQGLPGLVYATTEGISAKFYPVILGPGVAAPVKGPFGYFLNAANIPPAINSGWIPLVLGPVQPVDGTEKWCYSNLPNLDVTVDGTLITRTINPAAVKETLRVSSTPPVASGTFEYESFTVVSPGPILDGSGNEIKSAPYWIRSDQTCPGAMPGIIMSAFPITPNTTYKRTTVLILANW